MVVFLHAVHQHLDDKIRPAGLFDLLDGLTDEASTVLEALGTILIIAVVVGAGEKHGTQVGPGGVDFQCLEALFLEERRCVHDVCLDAMDFFERHRIVVDAAKGRHEVGLETKMGAVFLALLDEWGQVQIEQPVR